MIRNLIATLVAVFSLMSCATQGTSTVPTAGKCNSDNERRAIGEILSLTVACKQAFPDLAMQVEQTVKPLRDSYPGCFAEYDRPGPANDMLQVAVAMGGKLNDTKYCHTDLREGVKNVVSFFNG